MAIAKQVVLTASSRAESRRRTGWLEIGRIGSRSPIDPNSNRRRYEGAHAAFAAARGNAILQIDPRSRAWSRIEPWQASWLPMSRRVHAHFPLAYHPVTYSCTDD